MSERICKRGGRLGTDNTGGEGGTVPRSKLLSLYVTFNSSTEKVALLYPFHKKCPPPLILPPHSKSYPLMPA